MGIRSRYDGKAAAGLATRAALASATRCRVAIVAVARRVCKAQTPLYLLRGPYSN